MQLVNTGVTLLFKLGWLFLLHLACTACTYSQSLKHCKMGHHSQKQVFLNKGLKGDKNAQMAIPSH